MMSDAIDNWCCVQGTWLQGNTALGAMTYLIFFFYHGMFKNVCISIISAFHNKMNVVKKMSLHVVIYCHKRQHHY